LIFFLAVLEGHRSVFGLRLLGSWKSPEPSLLLDQSQPLHPLG
jgi:hypothetical protein